MPRPTSVRPTTVRPTTVRHAAWRRHLPTVLALAFGLVVLLWGLLSLQGVFRRERGAALETVDRQRGALVQYAQQALEQELDDALRQAESEIEDALKDPRLPATRLLRVEEGVQLLPRIFTRRPGDETPARDLYTELAAAESFPDADDRSSPWARRLELHQSFVEAVRGERREEIESTFRALLSHRLRFQISPALDVPATLALLDFFQRESTPARELLKALLHDGLEDEEGGEIPDLSRLLLAHRESFTAGDFDFLCARFVDLAERSDTPFQALLERSREASAAPVNLPAEAAGPVLAEDGGWLAEPRGAGRWVGAAVRVPEILERITEEMLRSGLLAAGERVVTASSLGPVLPLAELSLDVESRRWSDRRSAIAGRYRLKTGLVVFCAALAVGLSVLALVLQVRRHRLLELRTEFVSTVSHELLTPLASVRLMAETVARRAARVPALKDVPGLKDYPDRIVREVDGLTFLVENILSFNRLEKGRVEPRLRRQPVQGLVEHLRSEITAQAPRRVEVHAAPTDVILSADSELMKLLLLNLARNACLYNDREPVEIHVETERRPGGGCTIRVRDNGWGIPADEQKHVFEEFYRPAATARKVGGTGLGLTLCRRIMEMHGGTIRIAESSPSGTTFELDFPAAREENP